jgi:hypothetical protein
MKPMLLERDGQPCPYCLYPMDKTDHYLKPTTDHIRAKSRRPRLQLLKEENNYKRKPERTLVVCSQCNFMKADMTLDEFVLSLQQRNKELQQDINKNLSRIKAVSYLIQIGLEQ